MSGELFLEVRAEEIPARMLPGATRELATRLFEELMARGMPPAEIETGFTPRRLWLVMKRLPSKEPDSSVVEIGPPASAAFDAHGRPTAAASGFAKKFGADVADLVRVDLSKDRDFLSKGEVISGAAPKGERVVLRRQVAGAPTSAILAELVPTLLRSLSWAKSMKWGAGVGPWVRPVHGVVALFDGEVVPFSFFDVEAGRTTCGHPTLSPTPFGVSGAEDWRAKLAALGIVPEPVERERRLRVAMSERAAAAGGALVDDPELLVKLAAICEIPGVMEGSFAEELLELPREVLVASLRDHQSALTAEREGRLLPVFLTVMDRPDDPAGRVRAGNEWVVAARLADARFFWEKDRSVPLSDRMAALDGLAFHPKLGSYGGKWRRIDSLCRAMADALDLSTEEKKHLSESASLCKVDLVTEMVREFTSLQGIMGGIYARAQGLPEPVWTAIYDQYLPASSDDQLPRERTGRLLALADRIDTLAGFFGLALVPTGSRDPFGLRRAALAAVRLVQEFGTAIDLADIVQRAHTGYTVSLAKGAQETWSALRPFLEDRLRHLLEIEGFAYDEIEAGLNATGETFSYLGPLRERIAALHRVRRNASFLAVALAAKRIANITKGQPAHAHDATALELPAERALLAASEAFSKAVEESLARRDFAAGLAAVGQLAPSLESFFDEVLVMDPDSAKRANRLALLQRIGAEIARLADLSRLVVDKAELRAAD